MDALLLKEAEKHGMHVEEVDGTRTTISPSTTKVPGVTGVQLKPRQIQKVAIIGGGLMGSGIATTLLISNISVVVKEVNPQFLQRGQKMIAANLEGLVKRGSLTKDKMNKAISLLKGALGYSDFKDVDMVDKMNKAISLLKGALGYSDFKDVDIIIEAVIEKVPMKQSIFADIEKVCPPHCILASCNKHIYYRFECCRREDKCSR